MRKFAILFYLITSSNVLIGQALEPDEEKIVVENPKQNFGLGAGIDYGGFGGRYTYMPTQKFGLFASAGFNIVGVGLNGGITYKFIPDKRVTPTIGAMYGYNAVIVIEDSYLNDETSSTFYGPSFSLGIEVKRRRKEGDYWNFELVLPIRSSDFNDEIDRLQSNGYDVTEPLPIAFSIGYHFGMN